MTDQTEREAIARIVDPQTFDLIEHYNGLSYKDAENMTLEQREAATFKAYPQLLERRDEALAKADAILARPPGGEVVEAARGAFDYVCGLLPSAARAIECEPDNYVIQCMVNIGELRRVRALRAALQAQTGGGG